MVIWRGSVKSKMIVRLGRHSIQDAVIQNVIQRNDLVEADDGPEDSIIAAFDCFVTKELLSQAATGPTSDQFDQMECGFRDAPDILFCFSFVDSDQREIHQVDEAKICRDKVPVDVCAQTQAGKNREDQRKS